MSESEGHTNQRPDCVRVEFEFEDGERQVATGEDAEKWAQWFNEGVSWAVTRGRSPPNLKFEDKPKWMDSDNNESEGT